MNEKATASYVHLLTVLKKLSTDLNPSSIMTDFEQAAYFEMHIFLPNNLINDILGSFEINQQIEKLYNSFKNHMDDGTVTFTFKLY